MGLGDMNYSRFNNMGLLTDLNLDAWTVDSANVCMLKCGWITCNSSTVQCFSSRFLEFCHQERLGATRIYKRGIGDDSCLEASCYNFA